VASPGAADAVCAKTTSDPMIRIDMRIMSVFNRAAHVLRLPQPGSAHNIDGGRASVHSPPRELESTAARMAAIERRPSDAVG
jgi:hypothetical protein